MVIGQYSQERIREDVLRALACVYSNDSDLLPDELDVCERCIVHRFASYLSGIVECGFEEYYNHARVDVEYNRRMGAKKEMASEKGTFAIIPDVVIHWRGGDGNNICAMEFKKHNDCKRCDDKLNDKEKLSGLTSKNGSYCYKWGLLIIINPDERKGEHAVKMQWYQDGGTLLEPEYFKYDARESIFREC